MQKIRDRLGYLVAAIAALTILKFAIGFFSDAELRLPSGTAETFEADVKLAFRYEGKTYSHSLRARCRSDMHHRGVGDSIYAMLTQTSVPEYDYKHTVKCHPGQIDFELADGSSVRIASGRYISGTFFKTVARKPPKLRRKAWRHPTFAATAKRACADSSYRSGHEQICEWLEAADLGYRVQNGWQVLNSITNLPAIVYKRPPRRGWYSRFGRGDDPFWMDRSDDPQVVMARHAEILNTLQFTVSYDPAPITMTQLSWNDDPNEMIVRHDGSVEFGPFILEDHYVRVAVLEASNCEPKSLSARFDGSFSPDESGSSIHLSEAPANVGVVDELFWWRLFSGNTMTETEIGQLGDRGFGCAKVEKVEQTAKGGLTVFWTSTQLSKGAPSIGMQSFQVESIDDPEGAVRQRLLGGCADLQICSRHVTAKNGRRGI